jgi:hypothetical protein
MDSTKASGRPPPRKGWRQESVRHPSGQQEAEFERRAREVLPNVLKILHLESGCADSVVEDLCSIAHEYQYDKILWSEAPTKAETRRQVEKIAVHARELAIVLHHAHDITLAKLGEHEERPLWLLQLLETNTIAPILDALARAAEQSMVKLGPPSRSDGQKVIRGSPLRELGVECIVLFESHRGRGSAWAGDPSDFVELCAYVLDVAEGETSATRQPMRRVADDILQEWRDRRFAWGELPAKRRSGRKGLNSYKEKRA